MSTTNAISQTIKYYDRQAQEWVNTHSGNKEGSYWIKEMNRFHQLLPQGRILEIGSGAGEEASVLIRMGYNYTGTDPSKSLIKIAQKKNPRATFLPIAVHHLDFPAKTFDGFWTAATLIHIPKDRIDKALKKIKKVINPKGIGFISLKLGSGEKIDKKTGRWIAYYSKGEFKEILEKNGYKIIETQI